MKLTVTTLLLAGWLTLAMTSVSAATATEQEIQHLLNFIANSSCTFIRNDSPYSASKAREHIARKYEYLQSRIHTTEEFIQLTATQSSFSGKPYRIVCDGHESLSKDWLDSELRHYRKTR